MKKAIINTDIFTGDRLLEQHAVVIDGHRIHSVTPLRELPGDMEIDQDLGNTLLIPGFIDLQVNGGGGVLFNDDPTVNGLRTIGAAHRRYGTTGFFPTLITDSFEVMRQAVAAVDRAISEGVPSVSGIHLEGPFLNETYKGTHDSGKFRVIDEEGFEVITSLENGKTLVTIAPELTTPETISRLADAGVIVCAGHSACTYQQARQALAAGVTGFTHLFNAMTQLHSREPGMVGAALEDENSWFGIIADGHHSHPASFRAAIKAKNRGGAVLVTDAMPTVGADKKSFELNGETIRAVDGRCANAAGSLAGSDLDMISAVNNAARFAGIDWFEAVRMASAYPAKATGTDDKSGYIKPGYAADMIAVDDTGNVIKTWIGGKRFDHKRDADTTS